MKTLQDLPTDQRTETETLAVGNTTVHVVRVWDVYEDEETGDLFEQYAGERVYVDGAPALVYVNDDEVFA